MHENATQQLCELIAELGTQIGESIASRLLANQALSTPARPLSPRLSRAPDTLFDLSKVNLIKPDVKEPSLFRGDETNKHLIQEWIDVELYLNKNDLSVEGQNIEILDHLLGKAKRIIKVGLKSNTSCGKQTTQKNI